MCLKQGSAPDKLKVARVTPIYKSGGKDEFSNYRPKSILPICSKILDKIVHKQLYKFDVRWSVWFLPTTCNMQLQLPAPFYPPGKCTF